jgi:hypothetical protein
VRTEEFTMVGVASPASRFPMISLHPWNLTGDNMHFFSSVVSYPYRVSVSLLRNRHSQAPWGGTFRIGTHIERSVRSGWQ